MIEPINPPLLRMYNELVRNHKLEGRVIPSSACKSELVMDEEGKLPLIDLAGLRSEDERERNRCADEIAKAASEWGFFYVVNHSVGSELIEKMVKEQEKIFQVDFEVKTTHGLMNNSYRCGNPSAIFPHQFNWSEAFHVSLANGYKDACYGEFQTFREVAEEYISAVHGLGLLLTGVLVERLGQRKNRLVEELLGDDGNGGSYLRLNHYPPCGIMSEMSAGLVAHTDSGLLTILYQDEVGGLQVLKDSKWVAVKPVKDALIVNIADVFQVWSNGFYRSVEHKVLPSEKGHRYSLAYFLNPSIESEIGSYEEPSIYKKFKFGEFQRQIKEDVKLCGHKIGLPKFLK